MPSRLILISVLTILLLGIGGALGYAFAPTSNTTAGSGALDDAIIMRTEGGLLEVSTVTRTETFDSNTVHTVLGVPVANTIASIRVPATYRFHIQLAQEWRLLVRDKTFVAVAPPIKPSLPVAIDTGKLEAYSGGFWSQFTGNTAVSQLQRSITGTLNAKARQSQLIEFQRPHARKTVAEFIKKWVLTQGRWSKASDYEVHVFFADEPILTLEKDGYVPLPLSKLAPKT